MYGMLHMITVYSHCNWKMEQDMLSIINRKIIENQHEWVILAQDLKKKVTLAE